MGLCRKEGYLLRGPYNKDYGVVGSIFVPPVQGNLHTEAFDLLCMTAQFSENVLKGTRRCFSRLLEGGSQISMCRLNLLGYLTQTKVHGQQGR